MHERGPRDDDLGAEGREALVPDVEGAERVRGNAGRPRRLQQRRALAQHALVVREDRRHPRGGRDHERVEESAATGRLTPDDREVLGREQHRIDISLRLARAHRIAVHEQAVRAAAIDLALHEHLAPTVSQRRPDDRGRLPRPHERLVRRHPMGSAGREVADGLDEVRLALPVRADDDRHTAIEVELGPRVVAEVGELEPTDDHGAPPGARGRRRRGDTGDLSAAAGSAAAGTGTTRRRRRARTAR